MTRDPIGIAGGLNLSRFAANTAVNSVDPFGQIACFRVTSFSQPNSRSLRATLEATVYINSILYSDQKELERLVEQAKAIWTNGGEPFIHKGKGRSVELTFALNIQWTHATEWPVINYVYDSAAQPRNILGERPP
jgi:hypothetical protein